MPAAHLTTSIVRDALGGRVLRMPLLRGQEFAAAFLLSAGLLEVEVGLGSTYFSFSEVLMNFFSIFRHADHICAQIGRRFRLGMEGCIYHHRGHCGEGCDVLL